MATSHTKIVTAFLLSVQQRSFVNKILALKKKTQKNLTELENKMIELKNSIKSFNSRHSFVEERISNLEHKIFEMTDSEE